MYVSIMTTEKGAINLTVEERERRDRLDWGKGGAKWWNPISIEISNIKFKLEYIENEFFIKYKSCDTFLFLELTLPSHFNCKMNALPSPRNLYLIIHISLDFFLHLIAILPPVLTDWVFLKLLMFQKPALMSFPQQLSREPLPQDHFLSCH